MKRSFAILLVAIFAFSACNSADDKGKFTVLGNIKNAPDQKIFLEQLYFSQKNPEVLDTAEIKNGKFKLSAIAPEEGLYRIRMEKSGAGFIFINDKSEIDFAADLQTISLKAPTFNSPANHSLRAFIINMDEQRNSVNAISDELNQLKTQAGSDSILQVRSKAFDAKNIEIKKYLINYIDTTSNAVMALFVLGYTRNIEPVELEKTVGGLSKRFPNNQTITTIAAQFAQIAAQYKAKPRLGGDAPELTMADTTGKTFSLSALRGKYVLVDFWASWCGPCRQENPNVVKAYTTFKDKNFTILGVSLDKNKDAWVKAINTDNLTWSHISDLKQWNSAAVGLYGFEGIPYNVLVDPKGKIVAINLRGEELQTKLAEILK